MLPRLAGPDGGCAGVSGATSLPLTLTLHFQIKGYDIARQPF